jgi:hypothetical protein
LVRESLRPMLDLAVRLTEAVKAIHRWNSLPEPPPL